jgi:hypothetical protein
MPAEEAAQVAAVRARLETAVAGHDAGAIRKLTEDLDRATLPFAQRRMDRAMKTALVHQSVADVEASLPEGPVHPHLAEDAP